MTLLQDITEANKSFISGNPRLLDAAGDCFIVVSCIDPRLTGFLGPALGLPKDRAIIVRTAGNQVSATCNDALRSIVAGVYVKDGTEILVVGHTDCAMSKFSATDVIEKFRKAGIARSSFGDADMRTWFGAFSDVKANVLQGVEYLRKSELLPQSLKIHGLVLDIQDGKLEIVYNGDVREAAHVATVGPAASVVLTPSPPELPPFRPVESVLPVPSPPPVPGVREEKKEGVSTTKPVVIKGKTARQVTPTSMMDAAMILREVFVKERRDQKFQRTMAELSSLVRKEKNPVLIMNQLERVVAEYQQNYPNLPAALNYFRNSLESKGPSAMRFLETIARVLE